MSLIGLANQTMTTPALIEVVRRFPERVPHDASRYINEIFERNLIRNDRLLAQLMEAVAALNRSRIIPVLLKGSALLATTQRDRMGTRLISDLDVVVSPAEFETSLECLIKIGYRVYNRTPEGAVKCFADLERPEDAGMIDLHQGPPGRDFFYRSMGDLKQYCELRAFEQGEAYVPSATYHALLLIIHDQFQDSDYWLGNIDLRHLLDMRYLANTSGGIDWNALASFARGPLARNALEAQLMTLFSLLNVDVPINMRKRLLPRMQYWRRVVQIRFPLLRHAFLLMALLDYQNYLKEVGLKQSFARHLGPKTSAFLPQLRTMHRLLDLSRKQRNGKI
jgi:hypothetical protein